MTKIRILLLSLFLIFNFTGQAVADSSTPAKILAATNVTGNRTIVYESGRTEQSGDLWQAKIPTKIKLSPPSSQLSGTVKIQFSRLIQGEDGDSIRIEVALWTTGGKKIDDRTLFEWSPVSPSTTMEFKIYSFDKVKAGKYFWVITTSDYRYEGQGQLKIPVTLS